MTIGEATHPPKKKPPRPRSHHCERAQALEELGRQVAEPLGEAALGSMYSPSMFRLERVAALCAYAPAPLALPAARIFTRHSDPCGAASVLLAAMRRWTAAPPPGPGAGPTGNGPGAAAAAADGPPLDGRPTLGPDGPRLHVQSPLSCGATDQMVDEAVRFFVDELVPKLGASTLAAAAAAWRSEPCPFPVFPCPCPFQIFPSSSSSLFRIVLGEGHVS